jgi:signal transduction histidine kinase
MHGTLAAERARKIADEQFNILVGSAVHDIRGILNPLKTGFSSLLEHLKAGNLDPQLFRENLTKMSDRLEYLEQFVNDMREYSQATLGELRQERIIDVINDAKSMVQENLKGRGYNTDTVSLNLTVPVNITAEIARHQIMMTVAHVLKNAYEAFDANVLRVKQIEIRAQIADDNNVAIVIKDNGPGIAAEDLQDIRAFNPGTSTKKNRGGTGFGLPTAHRYAEEHGGNLAIESEEGKGTTVTITLPIEREFAENEVSSTCD